MSLKDDIANFERDFLKKTPEAALTLIKNTINDLVAAGIEQRALNVGDKIPSFTLPGTDENTVSSKQLLSKGPLVISFFRGVWCPYCNLELKALQDNIESIRKLNADLVAVSPQTVAYSQKTLQKNKLDFLILSDLENKLAKKFGLVFSLPETMQDLYASQGINLSEFNGNSTCSLPVPATYVVSKDSIICYAFINADYTKRIEPNLILDKLKTLS